MLKSIQNNFFAIQRSARGPYDNVSIIFYFTPLDDHRLILLSKMFAHIFIRRY